MFSVFLKLELIRMIIINYSCAAIVFDVVSLVRAHQLNNRKCILIILMIYHLWNFIGYPNIAIKFIKVKI